MSWSLVRPNLDIQLKSVLISKFSQRKPKTIRLFKFHHLYKYMFEDKYTDVRNVIFMLEGSVGGSCGGGVNRLCQ